MNIPDMPRVEKLYNLRAVSDILGSPRVTIIGWIQEGKLRAFKLPDCRQWRIRESDLLAFISAGEEDELE